ncbi:hypothetical protein [Devriesea agamarum]|uniref:hypothetical protein n=1 Tax=Devriesea agamarum TaxID=472569 RepID=UPI00071D7A47|nr:hypothetical protein [Devriesea agamarum]
MAFQGMSPEQGREAAGKLKHIGQQVAESFDHLSGVVNSVNWLGPDAEAFKQDWLHVKGSSVHELAEALKQRGENLAAQADDQDATSNQR